MIHRVSQPQRIEAPASGRPAQAAPGASFGAVLRQEQARAGGVRRTGIQFSKHALTRADQRGIALTPDLVDRLADSVERAQAKGDLQNILAFDAAQAFIINVPCCKVITTLSQAEMKEDIFTNIDGAVLL